MSSAFVPTPVLNCMQESYHHALTSRIEEVPVEPTPAPGFTMVGGPSRAPVRSVAPVHVATFKPTGISYAKVTSLPMQSMSGSSSKPAPFNMGKERELLKKAGIQLTAEPLRTAHKALDGDNDLKAMMEVLKKHKKFTDFASASPIVQNAVASSSSSAPPPPAPRFEDCLKTPTPEDRKAFEEREKRRRQRKRAATKAMKETARLQASQLPHGRALGNVQVFPEVSTNPISENGEPLFLLENQAAFPNSPSIINPKHPHARYFKALIKSLNFDDNEGHLNDPCLDMNHRTDYKSQVQYKEPLDWGTPSDVEQELEAQDEPSGSDIDDDIASAMGMSRLSITPAPSNRLSKSKGKQQERMPHGGDDRDNFLDSHAYDDYGYHRSVSTNLPTCMLSDDETTQLLNSLSSLESRLEFICNNMNSHSANCAKCKTPKTQNTIEIMADNGASISFTHTKSDLSEFKQPNNKNFVAKTASNTTLYIKGVGAMMLTHRVTHKGKSHSMNTRLYPVYFLPGLSHRLLSVGQLLNDGLELRGSSQMLNFSAKTHTNVRQTWMQCKPHSPGQNIYWLSARLTSKHAMLALSLVHIIDYNIMHRRFAHPSKDVL